MSKLFTNNAATLLAAPLASGGLSCTVLAGTGALFPAVVGPDTFNCTLIDGSGNIEIVSVTARTTDTFTIVRAQEGTIALNFVANDKIELRITAGNATNWEGKVAPADVQTQLNTAFTTAGTSTVYTLTTSPVAAALVANQRYRVKLHTANGAAPTLTRDGLAAKAIKLYDATGAKVDPVAAQLPTLFDVEYDGTDYVVLDPLPGMIVNQVDYLYTTYTALSTVMPFDNTIPQITEGTEIITTPAYTPRKATNTIRLEMFGDFSTSTSAGYVSAAFFQDAITNALRATGRTVADNQNMTPLVLQWSGSAGSAASRIYRLRVGPDTGNAFANGTGTGAKFGGTMAVTMRLTEIAS